MVDFSGVTGRGTVVGVNSLSVADQTSRVTDLFGTPLANETTKRLFADAQHLQPSK